MTDLDEYPSIHSSDPNERKLARRMRIQRSLAKSERDALLIADPDADIAEKTITEKQIESTWVELLKLMQDGDEAITSVQKSVDARETHRRTGYEDQRARILKQLDAEDRVAQALQEKINEKWDSILAENDVLEMNRELLTQKQKCDDLIAQKNDIIQQLNDELDRQESEFFAECQQDKEEMKILCSRIDAQVNLMRNAYRHELDMIEQAILREQTEIITRNASETERLFDRYENLQVKNLDEKCELVARQYDKLDEMTRDHEERYRVAKMDLDAEIEALQVELQNMKAVCLMNDEKLNYNYQILKRREQENSVVKAVQKRRINRLQDIIDEMKTKIAETEHTTNAEIKKLTSEIMTLHRNIINTQNKFQNLSDVNERKYWQIWRLNQHECEKIIDKILAVDRVVHEQILQIEWRAPIKTWQSDAFKRENSASKSNSESNSCASSSSLSLSIADDSWTNKRAVETLGKSMTHLLSDECDFLIDECIQGVVETNNDNAMHLVRIDNVFSALNITHENDMNILLKYFLSYAFCPICNVKGKSLGLQSSVAPKTLPDPLTKVQSQENDDESVASTETFQLITRQGVSDAYERTSVASMGSQSEQSVSSHSSGTSLSLPSASRTSSNSRLQTSERHKKRSQSSSSYTRILPAIHTSSIGTRSAQSRTNVANRPRTQSHIRKIDKKIRCALGHIWHLQSAHILQALHDFTSDAAAIAVSGNNDQTNGYTKPSCDDNNWTSRTIKPERVEQFWSQMVDIFPAEKQLLWDATLMGLKKYNELLTERDELLNDVTELRQVNTELEQFLTDAGAGDTLPRATTTHHNDDEQP